jgi:hypothetical protein
MDNDSSLPLQQANSRLHNTSKVRLTDEEIHRFHELKSEYWANLFKRSGMSVSAEKKNLSGSRSLIGYE